MSRFSMKTTGTIFSIILLGWLLIACIMHVGLNPRIYQNTQEKYEISSYAGVDEETLKEATIMLIQYMDGKQEDLDMQGAVFGVDTELFNEKEKIHMEDVRDLFDLGKMVLFFAGVVMILILYFMAVIHMEDFLNVFFKTAYLSLGILTLLILFGVVFAFLNFSWFWEVFHKVLFTNDLWLLDPRVDLLIRMMPEKFFISLSIEIVWRFALMIVSMEALLIWCDQKLGKVRNHL